jgi:hypothetical protein
VWYGLTVDGCLSHEVRRNRYRECLRETDRARAHLVSPLSPPSDVRTAIPRPFNRIPYDYRGPSFAPKGLADSAVLGRFQVELEDDLVDLAAESYAAMGQARPTNLVRRPTLQMIAGPS